ncbi:Vacuolar protein sorting-associated protein 26B [Orchesella cincta]|uniref:Vacuolar protein sorting-associated protein 26 n=1 Tax=Orchesella cincta TaxID=48709 RepID=A0A1D2NHU6_ORCCI|nr:Vacuolar protein sorting-associated protein 26B [Orchesella cincta]
MVKNFFGFGPSADIDIVLDGQDTRKTAEIKTEDGKKERHLLYFDGEHVSGKVHIHIRKPGSRLEHFGIKVELFGQIELYYDRGNHHNFLHIAKELARPGDLFQHTTYNFDFQKVDKPFESYTGSNVKLRYFLRATVVRRLSDIVKEKEIVVQTLSQYPEMNSSIKMEVGIEDCLHIEFEYNKSKYHLKDVIVGKIYFLLVRIKIKHMEIAIIKRETTGSGPNTFNENETIAKYEIMDGAPVRGESIPIRVFLSGYELTPTMKDINKKFSVRYYLNLVLVDEEDRRYFKQQEIILWRKADKTRRPFQASLQQQYKQMQNPNVQFSNNYGSGRLHHGQQQNDEAENADSSATRGQGEVEELLRGKDDEPPSLPDRFAHAGRSPLEQDSELSTPEKEFQSVINSKDNRVISPLVSPQNELPPADAKNVQPRQQEEQTTEKSTPAPTLDNMQQNDDEEKVDDNDIDLDTDEKESPTEDDAATNDTLPAKEEVETQEPKANQKKIPKEASPLTET